MLARKLRVKRQDFPDLIKKGRVFHTEIFSVRYIKGINPLIQLHSDAMKTQKFSQRSSLVEIKTNNTASRFGVVVPKTVSKSAVKRNLLKRRLWACIQEHQTQILSGYDIVFFMKKGADKISFSDLKQNLSKALLSSKLLS